MTELDSASLLDGHAARAKTAREALVGRTVAGRYVLRGLLGHGGMGAVYEAEHVGLGKRVAIKFVDPEFATDEQVVARFAREARAMSAIESAHIVSVFDAGSEDGRPYLVMELLRGEDLGQRLRRTGRIPLGQAMHVVAQVLKGLARAHGAGIVHRDLKPDNVFLVKHDTDRLFAKIVDFGISKIERPRANTHPLALTGRGTVLGTPFYMSPEQAQASSDVDGRTDLYSVGAILFECLTGRPPHTGESYEQIILSICMRDAPAVRSIDPSVPENVSAFVARALARDRAQRFTSAERMLGALHEVAPEERTRVPLDPPSAETLMSPGMQMAATMLDGGAPRSSRPSVREAVGAATRLGVGALEGEGAAGARAKVDAKANANARPDAGAKANADVNANANANANAADLAPGAAASGASRPRAKKKAARRPFGMAVATAVVATLTGVGVAFLVISMLGKTAPEPRPSIATSAAVTSASALTVARSEAWAAPSASPSAAPDSVPSAAPSASASAPIAPVSTASAKPSTPAVAPPRPAARPTLPQVRPSAQKPLDIQRDLP